MITIISGTNRSNSNSIKIAHQYQELLEEKGVGSTIIDLEDLPKDFMFSALYENRGKNADFSPIMELIKKSQKFVFIVPEYNGSFPGALKVFLDALEYPSILKDKKSALIGISTGIQGSTLAMSHLTDILNYLGMHVLALKPKIMDINHKMDGEKITDEFSLKLLNDQAEALIQF